MRWRADSAPFSRFMNVSTGPNASGPLMTEAGQIYLKAKGASRRLPSLRLLTGPSDILYQ